METTNPLVSLCMATCLRADLFPEALAGLLRQTYSPLEIVVLADGADAGSLAVLKNAADPRVRWITTPAPSGMVPAWNRVVREARGKYVLFCADDDVLLERAIDQQVSLLEAHDAVAFCHADFIFIDDDGAEIGRWVSHRGRFIDAGADAWPDYVVRTRCCMQTTVVRKSVWDQVGGWDEDAGNPGDNSLYLKLLRHGAVAHVPHVACKYRIRTRKPDSWEKKFSNLREFLALSEKHLAHPPPGVRASAARIRRRLLSGMARTTIPLVASAPGADERNRIRAWMRKTIWPGSGFGRVCAWSDRVGALPWVDAVLGLEARARQMAKRVLLGLRRTGRK
jgi:GT2 family glycosyltransferase